MTWISLVDEESIRKGVMGFPIVGYSLASSLISGVSHHLCTMISIFLYLNGNFLMNNKDTLRKTPNIFTSNYHAKKFDHIFEFRHGIRAKLKEDTLRLHSNI